MAPRERRARCAQEAFPTRAITMIVPFPPGRRRRHHRAPDGRSDGKNPQAAGRADQPSRRRRRGRQRGGRQREARRLHDPDGALEHFGDPRGRPALRSQACVLARPVRADRADHGGPDHTRRAPLAAREVAEGARRARALEAGRAFVLDLRHLRRAAHADGDVPARGEAENAPRADDRRRPCDHGVLGGHVDLTAGGPAAITSHVKAGKLRPLASWGPKRHEGYPDVPTFKELGYDIEYLIWAGMFAPKGTPEPVMKVLRDAARKAVEDPEFKGMMAKVNSPVHYLDAPEFAKFWQADAKRLAEVVKVVGKVEEKK